jgi:hypothetical protein
VLVVLKAVLRGIGPVSTSASSTDKALEEWRMLACAPSIVSAVMPTGTTSATAVGGDRGPAKAHQSVRYVPHADVLLRCYHRDQVLLKAVSGLVEGGSEAVEVSALWSKRLLEQWCIV